MINVDFYQQSTDKLIVVTEEFGANKIANEVKWSISVPAPFLSNLVLSPHLQLSFGSSDCVDPIQYWDGL